MDDDPKPVQAIPAERLAKLAAANRPPQEWYDQVEEEHAMDAREAFEEGYHDDCFKKQEVSMNESNVVMPLDGSCQVGQTVSWHTISGVQYVGVLREWDNGTAIVELRDGTRKAIRADI